jgi:selenocysteine lyase/cysteine desulfurase
MATTLESYFAPFRRQIVGIDQEFDSPYGRKKVVYADWTASGRLFGPIEERLLYELGPFVGNTHTETTITGSAMTQAYHESLAIIKKHVNANASDVILTCESGMTGAVNKLQRILGFRVHENFVDQIHIPHQERPVVFITHMEHHSNHTSWLETVAEVICIEPTEAGMVDLEDFKFKLAQYQDRKVKIAAVSAASNVTGIIPPYYEIARIIHQNGGLCFVDFACSGPYVQIDMHPAGDPLAKLDAIYFSPHKFLGGPGTPGIVIFDSKLYNNRVPDQPGGGTVSYTSPWGDHRYLLDIEVREDGGTPPFLQTIKAAMAMRLKEEMGGRKHPEPGKGNSQTPLGSHAGHSQSPHPGRPASGAIGHPVFLHRGPAFQPRRSPAQRPLWHPGERGLFLRRYLWALPAAHQPQHF